MFEKETEEYLKKKNYTGGYIGYFASGYCEQSFKDGAEFGYNKANEWHNINDIEPSKEQFGKYLLIRIESVIGNTDYDYLVYKYKGESISDVAGVLAWKEIK